MAARKDERDHEDLIEQVRRLEEKVRQLQSSTQAVGEQGLAESLVAALGRLVPGLQKLIEVGSRMPQFHQQLAAIDEEIKRKFKDQPLRSAAVTFARDLQRRTSLGIPPSVHRSRSRQDGASCGKAVAKPRGGYRRRPAPKVRLSPEAPATLHADVFDEGRDVVVLAEAPGLTVEHVTARLDGESLLAIRIDEPGSPRQGLHRVELPCAVGGQPEVSLGNNVLTIRLRKKGRS